MIRLDILVHGDCLSERPARELAHDVQHEFPHWKVDIRVTLPNDKDQFGVLVFPAFLLNGHLFVTGVPRKDWLIAKLRAWEKGEK
jgi:hypothetical protein